MKLLTYRTASGEVRHGRLSDDESGVIDWGTGDLSGVVGGTERPSAATTAVADLADVTVLTPLLHSGKILCVATNYQEHIVEGGGTRVDPTRTSPKLFTKPDSALAGTGEPFLIPEISTKADWEAELAVIIGKECRGISADVALDYVFGYAASNDLSLRSLDQMGFERDTENPWVGFFDWLGGKWADGSAPVGPYLVTADEVPDPQNLTLSLHLNGEVRQQSSTSAMIFGCAELIAFASRLGTLRPGDIILTGTPSGVGATTGTYLTDGDVMVVEVQGMGKLVTPVRAG